MDPVTANLRTFAELCALAGAVWLLWHLSSLAHQLRRARRAEATTLVFPRLDVGLVPRGSPPQLMHDQVYCAACLHVQELAYSTPYRPACPSCSSHLVMFRKRVGEEMWAELLRERRDRGRLPKVVS